VFNGDKTSVNTLNPSGKWIFNMAANEKNNFLFQLIVCLCVLSDAAVQDDFLDTEDSMDYSSDDIRCYCNLPVCVSTSYMCKSDAGVCFSEIVEDIEYRTFRGQEGYKRRHGCLELLEDEDQKSECRNMLIGGSFRGHRSLFCCSKDMCNHVDSRETIDAIQNHTKNEQSLRNDDMFSSPGYNSNEVWFKAAIIAVPICGCVILFLLIFLAVKILKTDSLNTSNKLGVPYPHSNERKSNRDHFDPSSIVSNKKISLLIHHHDISSPHTTEELLKSVPLLVNETGVNYDKKNETNAKLNLTNGELKQNKESNSPLLGLQKNISNSMYRNVNLSITPVKIDESDREKLYEKPVLTSVISWGPSNSSSPV